MFRARAFTPSALLLLVSAGCFGGCDLFGDDAFGVGAGFYDLPDPAIVGEPFSVRASGDSDGSFTFAKVLVFRSRGRHDTDVGIMGDTLVVADLDVTPGSSRFDDTVAVTIPAGSVTEATRGWIYVEYGNTGCRTGCIGARSQPLNIAP